MTWSTDAGSVIPIVSYSATTLIATLGEGTYIKAQNGFSCNSSVSVSGFGPTITALFTTPASPITLGSVIINATGDDSAGSNQSISLCQVRIDSGLWQAMNANDGAYDEIIEDVSLDVGTLTNGLHTATVRCNNSDGDFGSQGLISFRVDRDGPSVSALFTTPASISAGDSIIINATGSDSGLGDSNISLCQVSVDGGVFSNMNSADGTYDEVTEAVYLSIGPKSVGQHNATVKCNDSAGNWGNVSTINFTVNAKPILFITNGVSPSTDEQRWLDWIDAHSSGEGFDWSYERAQDSDVVSGSTNVTDYEIALMAEYDTGAGIETALQNYQSAGGIVVLLADAVEEGPNSLGYSASVGAADGENEIGIVNNSHYITSGFSIGRLIILGSSEVNWRNTDDLGGTILADGMKANKQETGEPVLDDATNLITWGPTRPDSFNSNGDTITTRILDYALNASTIG
jgi:hypothetical protein